MSADETLSDERRHYAVRTPLPEPEPWVKPEADTAGRLAKIPPFETFRRRTGRFSVTGAVKRAIIVETDYATPFLLIPVLLGVGAVSYFGAATEPGWRPLLLGISVALIALWAVRRAMVAMVVLFAVFLLLAGALSAKFETWRMATKMLGSPIMTSVTGTVVSVEHQPGGRSRVVIDIVETARPRLRFAPDRVRLVARNLPASTGPGMTITGRARLLPHSGPIYPHGYDFTFHNYFRGIGATGFFFGTPDVAGQTATILQGPAILLERARAWLTERIKQRVGGAEGEIAAALITGAKSGIPEPVNEALRRTGLAHILSISGLHMALVAGTVIAGFRLAFAGFPDFASRHPVKKYAAAAALATIFVYLFISGAGIATKRSFLMLAVMLLAVMFDRPAITMRNLAIAAIIILLAQPHEIAGPGFQMSFAATAALVAAYRGWTLWRQRRAEAISSAATAGTGRAQLIASKLLQYASALAVTSLIAGAATAIYGVWHFQRLAPLGLFANLAAMPVVSLLVMPSAVLAVLMIPFDLDGPAFALMGQGIKSVVWIAGWFSERTPVDNIGMIPLASVLFASAGLVTLTVSASRLKWIGIPIFAIALATALAVTPPDILVEENGKMITLRRSDGDLALNTSRPRRFALEIWQRALNSGGWQVPLKLADEKLTRAPDRPETFHCGKNLCLLKMENGAVVAHAKTAEDAASACPFAQLIIVESALVRAGTCKNKAESGPQNMPKIITGRDLARYGSASIAVSATSRPITGNQWEIEVSHAISMPWRPWHAHRAYSRAARGMSPWQPAKQRGSKRSGRTGQ
ncbi:MAG: ComEC/Rec2 family competence protein [Rhizobiaceae bacterium]